MNRTLLGALGALLLAAAGLFWWQGRAETERGAPPPDIGAEQQAVDPDLPEAGAHGRGAGLPEAAKAQKSKQSTEQRRYNRYDKNHDGRITRNEMLSTRVAAFKKLDTNHDNLLSFEEWAVKTSNRFKEIDRNGDGVISSAELAAYYAAKDAKPKRASCACGSPITHRSKNARPEAEPSEVEGGEPGQ